MEDAAQLGKKTLRRLQPAFDVVDGVSRVEDVELAVEDVKFQRKLLDCRAVEVAQQEKIMRVLAKL